MIVFTNQLIAAAEQMASRDRVRGVLSNGVPVTHAQLVKAAEILGESPKPECMGLKSSMPGFIDPEDQIDGLDQMLVLTVGILPSTRFWIDWNGEVRTIEWIDEMIEALALEE